MANSIATLLRSGDLWQRVARVPARLQTLRGRKRLAVAAGLGALSALAYGPFYLWPVVFFTFPALVWLIDGARATRRPWLQAGFIAWVFGFGYFLAGLHWVGFAFVVDIQRHVWLLPFVAVLMPGGLALFFAGAAALARLRWSTGPARIVTFAAALSAFEWLRGHVLTGLPWNLTGNVWDGWDAMFQSVSIFGIYGLSLVTLVVASSPATLVDDDGKPSGLRWPIGAAAGVLAAMLLFGWLRLPSAPVPTVENIALRIVQPNVPQSEKWKPELLERNWRLLLDLTREPGLETRTHVIWPEAAPPFLMLSEPAAFQVIAQILPDATSLLTGVVRAQGQGPDRKYFNSMTAVTGKGEALAVYDKAHLVPFGEYLPLFRLLEPLGVTKITGGREGYSEGPGVKTLTIPRTPAFGPLICYEVIFPGEVVETGRRPDWLVVLTDDSWFGPWTGPYQHLGIAKIRAAEEGLPIVRAANTGVSAVLDPYGRIVTSLGLDQMGIVDAMLPKPLAPTVYAQIGDTIFALMLVIGAGVSSFFYRSTSQDC